MLTASVDLMKIGQDVPKDSPEELLKQTKEGANRVKSFLAAILADAGGQPAVQILDQGLKDHLEKLNLLVGGVPDGAADEDVTKAEQATQKPLPF